MLSFKLFLKSRLLKINVPSVVTTLWQLWLNDTYFTIWEMFINIFIQTDQITLYYSWSIGCKSVRYCLIPNFAAICVNIEYAHWVRKRKPCLDTTLLRHAKAMQWLQQCSLTNFELRHQGKCAFSILCNKERISESATFIYRPVIKTFIIPAKWEVMNYALLNFNMKMTFSTNYKPGYTWRVCLSNKGH